MADGTPDELINSLSDKLLLRVYRSVSEMAPTYHDYMQGVRSKERVAQTRCFLLDMFTLTQAPVTKAQFRKRVQAWLKEEA